MFLEMKAPKFNIDSYDRSNYSSQFDMLWRVLSDSLRQHRPYFTASIVNLIGNPGFQRSVYEDWKFFNGNFFVHLLQKT